MTVQLGVMNKRTLLLKHLWECLASTVLVVRCVSAPWLYAASHNGVKVSVPRCVWWTRRLCAKKVWNGTHEVINLLGELQTSVCRTSYVHAKQVVDFDLKNSTYYAKKCFKEVKCTVTIHLLLTLLIYWICYNGLQTL